MMGQMSVKILTTIWRIKMGYILEHDEEFNRLERQTKLPGLDYREELKEIEVKNGAFILDAGCGSGIVSRYLAERFPSSRVIACDFTSSILKQAREAAKGIPNVSFEEQDLKRLTYTTGQFDLIISRLVVHLQDNLSLSKLIAELARVLKPGGTLVVIDIDGNVVNLYPQTPLVTEGLQKLAASHEVDVFVGRKLPLLLSEAGLVSVSWRMETFYKDGENACEEMRARFQNASAFYERTLGDKEKCNAFVKEYLECMKHPQSVYFYHKFIVSAKKP